MPREKRIKEEISEMTHSVRGFTSWSVGSIAFRLWYGRNFMLNGYGGKLHTS